MVRQKIEKIGLIDKENCDEPVLPSRKKYLIVTLVSVLAVVVIAISAVAIGSYAFDNRMLRSPESTSGAVDVAVESNIKSAVAFEGGGFLAHSVYTGFIEGLTKVASEKGSTEATLAATNILGRFDAISTVSGGSWFMSELAFSNSFLSLVQSAASDPTTAGAMYNKQWMAPFMKLGSNDNIFVKGFADVVKDFGDHAFAQDLKGISYFWSKGLTWSDFVSTLLLTTGQIEKTTTLGGDVNEWSQDKIWAVGHSLVTPGGSCSYCDKEATFWQKDGGLDFAEYTLTSSKSTQPLFTPARYSIKLGSGEGSSPLTYCAPGMCEPLSVQYKGANWAGVDRFSTPGSLVTTAPENYADALPLTQVVAASSAFLGAACTSDSTDVLQDLAGSHFAVWTSSSADGESFSTAESTLKSINSADEVTSTTLKTLSSQGIHSVIDGGYTDNTGIAHAVAAGANEVVSFLVSASDLVNLFQGSPSKDDVALGIYELYFQIFQETAQQVQAQINKFETLDVGTAKYLKSVKLGTLTVTTANNAAFGISSGRTITLHVVAVDSALSIGGLENFYDYGTLVQEIVSAVTAPANKAVCTQKLLGFMLG